MPFSNYPLIFILVALLCVWMIDAVITTNDDEIILENSRNKRDTPLAATNADLMTSQLELSISAKNVADEKTPVNPICVVFIQEPESAEWTEHSRTEVVMNNQDPVFTSKISITYRFGTKQPLKFQIHTSPTSSSPSNLNEYNLLGYSTTSLAQLTGIGSEAKLIAIQENRGPKRTNEMFIFVTIEETQNSKEQVVLELQAEDLSKKWTEFFTNMRPFIEIQRHAEEEDKDHFIYKTEVLNKTYENFRWRRFVIPRKILSDKNIKFTIRNWHPKKKHESIGEFETSLEELHKDDERKFSLKCLKNRILSGGNCGYVRITYFKILSNQSFIQSIIRYTKLRTMIGIDFSYDNNRFRGHNYRPFTPDRPNIYEESLTSILSILEEFDPKKRFSVYGYPINRRHPKSGEFFPLYNQVVDGESVCVGKDDVIGAYRNFMRDVGAFYEDANPAPIIIKAADLAEKQPSNYQILLLLTTGYFHEPEKYFSQTIEAIKKASPHPLSIVIIGMSSVEFPLLHELIEVVNEQLDRDMLTFVTYEQFSDTNLLAKEALSKIPQQVLSYKLI